MKKPNLHGVIPMKWPVFILTVVLLLLQQVLQAQVISLNGVYISTTSGTVVKLDTLRINSSSTLDNAGTHTLASIINDGAVQGNGTINISSLFTNTGTFTANSSTVNFNGDGNQTIPALTYYNLSASGSGSIKTAAGNTVVNGALTYNSGNTIDMVTYPLTGSLTSIAGTGTLKSQNTSSTPVPTGKTWTGTIEYNSTSSQTIVYGNYNNLNGTGGDRVLSNTSTIGIAAIFTPGAGIYTITGTTLDFNGSSAQTIPAFTFENITCSGGSTKNVGGLVNVRADLTLAANTTLALGNNNLKLKSDSTYTARLASVPATASITYGTGRFIAERYVKGRRKYRLITSPVTTSPNASLIAGEEAQSIWGNWQNQGNNSTPNAGTFITGGSAADGFDVQTTNASMFTYNAAARLYTGFTTANSKNTKYTPLKAGVAYYMFVWGDRTNSPVTANPYKTVLTSTGTILTGDQTYNSGSTFPLTNTVDGYTMIGNPFASPINWATVTRTNLSDTYWGWDPNLNSTGGYVTVSTTGTVTLISPFSGSVGLDQYIQSGQGFFVKTTATSPVLVIKESDKVSNFNANAFRTESNNIPLIAVNLFHDDAGTSTLMDGALAAFDPSFSNDIGNEDASKMSRPGEEVSFKHQAELLSIHARKMPTNGDTLHINNTGLTKSQYRLQIFANQLDSSSLEPWLVDRYLQSNRLLSLTDTTNILINIDPAIPATAAANRFYIIFNQSGDPALTITSVDAVKENRTVRVSWTVSSEDGIQKYEVERADDFNAFTRKMEITAALQPAYRWVDDLPALGPNHYRIRVYKYDGSSYLSRIVTVNMETEKPEMKIFPNPVVDHILNIQFKNLQKGNYTVRFFNNKGELVYQQAVNYTGGPGSEIVRIGSHVASGIYHVQVTNNKIKMNQTIIIR